MRKADKPRIILFDLETLPSMEQALKVFTSLSDYPGQSRKATINSIICFGYKILEAKQTKCINAWDFKAWKKDVNDDYELVKAAREILISADAVVTHNGARFDWPFLQTRLLVNGLAPLPKINHIDTCLIARKQLRFFNNKLDTIGDLLVNKKKVKHDGWPLWIRVHNRESKALKEMETYCKGDVTLLESIFLKLQAFSSNIPNHNLFTKDQVCPNCGSLGLVKNGKQYSKTSSRQRFFCHECGSTSYAPAKGIVRT